MKRSSRKPSHASVPMSGMWKSRSNSAPNPSTIVAPRITNPQNTAKCAAPGTLHFSSLRCPKTSVATAQRAGSHVAGAARLHRLPGTAQPVEHEHPPTGQRERRQA